MDEGMLNKSCDGVGWNEKAIAAACRQFINEGMWT